MKNTRALNRLIEQSHMDKDMIASKVQIAKEKLDVNTSTAYDADEFLRICQVCNIKPEVVFRLVRQDGVR